MISWQLIMLYLPLLVLLGWAVASDVRGRRIPNWLTVTLAVSGIAMSLTGWGLVSPAQAGLGLLVGFVVPFVVFALGGLGAGDVKLLAGIGAWVGGLMMIYVLLLTGIIGGVLVLGMSLWQRRLGAVMRNVGMLVMSLIWSRQVGLAHAREMGQTTRGLKQTVPYAVAIACATVAVLLSNGFRS